MAKVYWIDLGRDIYHIATFDASEVEGEALLYPYANCWYVEDCRGDPVPVSGRTLNELKEDAECWLREQGYRLLKVGCEYRDVPADILPQE